MRARTGGTQRVLLSHGRVGESLFSSPTALEGLRCRGGEKVVARIVGAGRIRREGGGIGKERKDRRRRHFNWRKAARHQRSNWDEGKAWEEKRSLQFPVLISLKGKAALGDEPLLDRN